MEVGQKNNVTQKSFYNLIEQQTRLLYLLSRAKHWIVAMETGIDKPLLLSI